MNKKTLNRIGWFASAMGIAVFFSYLDQVRLNISGHPGSVILPIITTVNCVAWALYGWLRTSKDWPIVICNLLGIVVGILTAVTAIMG